MELRLKLLHLCIVLMLIDSNGVQSVESEIFYFNEVNTCKNNEFFDIDDFKCKKCEESVASKDRLTCECPKTSIERVEYDNLVQQPICDRKCSSACPKNATIIIPEETDCGLKIFNQTSRRQQLKHIQMFKLRSPSNCTCDPKTNFLYRSTYCIPNILLKDYGGFENYPVGQNKQLNLKPLIFLCHDMKIKRECNYLANLCVLSDFNLDKNSPCTFAYKSQINDFSGSTDSEHKYRPHLFYKKGRSSVDELDKVIDYRYSLKEGDSNRKFLNFSLIKFNLEGHLQQFQESTLKFINLCSKQFYNFNPKFGENFYQSCLIKLADVYKYHRDTGFYSIYLRYRYNKVNILKRIPVLIRNEFKNRGENRLIWQLVTRFYIADFTRGIKPHFLNSLFADDTPGEEMYYVKMIKSAQLRVRIKEGNIIQTPLLVLEYHTVNLTEAQDVETGFSFSVTFERGMDFDTFLEIMLPIFLLLGFIITICETISYKIRESKQLYDFQLLGKFLVLFMSKVSTTLFLSASIISIYMHLVYKTQNEVKIILPNEIEDVVRHFFLTGLLLKAIRVVDHFWTISNVDLFFIDWERPKLTENNMYLKSSHLETPSSMGSRQTNFESNVSAWRNYFIANEWLELTTKRKISMLYHILAMLVLFYLFGMENFSSSLFYFHFNTIKSDTAPDMSVFTISTGIIVYLTSYISQRIFNFIVWERYVKNPVQSFIDVCSIANVSVFILSQRSYGYYIHGRSPHGFSDTDMCSMVLQFKREEENLCGHRGLLPGSEQQTYSMLAPKNLRVFYDRLVTPLQKSGYLLNNTLNYSNGFDVPSGKASSDKASFEKTVMTYQNINKFFIAFIDHSLKDLDYVVRERTILEWMLNCEIELSTISDDRGIFYVDNGHSFDEIIFIGSERLILQFEIMLFSAVVAFSGNFILAIIIIGITYKILEFTVACVTKHNLARKTLIDKRFLI